MLAEVASAWIYLLAEEASAWIYLLPEVVFAWIYCWLSLLAEVASGRYT